MHDVQYLLGESILKYIFVAYGCLLSHRNEITML